MLADWPLLTILAVLMSLATAKVLKWTVGLRAKPISAAVSVYLLIMMASMSGGAVIYLTNPSATSLTWTLALNMTVMMGGVALLGGLMIARGAEESAVAADTVTIAGVPNKLMKAFIPSVIFLTIANEFLMGWAFQLASGTTSLTLSGTSALGTFTSVITSYWFIFPMALGMALTTMLLRSRLGHPLVLIIAFQSATMFLAPTAIANPSWMEFSVLGESALMVCLFVYIFEYLARNRTIQLGFWRYILELMLSYAIMMGGLLQWELDGFGFGFAIALVLGMVIYLDITLGKGLGPRFEPWLSDAKRAVATLSAVFVAELCMGASIFPLTLSVLPLFPSLFCYSRLSSRFRLLTSTLDC